jgi:hypothetical protein
MKLILLLILTLNINPVLAMTGTEIATKVYDSNREPDSIQKSEMTLIDKSKNTRKRSFTAFAIDNKRYDSKNLVIFTRPKKVENTSMLTYNRKGENSLQWLFLPALKKSRKISNSKKSGRFAGSDVFFEDLENREVELDNHKLLKTIKKKNKTFYMLESTPKKKDSSSYKKTIVLVDAETWLVKKAVFFAKGKKPLKTLTVKKTKKIGKTWVPILTEIRHHKLRHKTIIEVIETSFDNKLEDSFFNKSSLENHSKFKKFL